MWYKNGKGMIRGPRNVGYEKALDPPAYLISIHQVGMWRPHPSKFIISCLCFGFMYCFLPLYQFCHFIFYSSFLYQEMSPSVWLIRLHHLHTLYSFSASYISQHFSSISSLCIVCSLYSQSSYFLHSSTKPFYTLRPNFLESCCKIDSDFGIQS